MEEPVASTSRMHAMSLKQSTPSFPSAAQVPLPASRLPSTSPDSSRALSSPEVSCHMNHPPRNISDYSVHAQDVPLPTSSSSSIRPGLGSRPLDGQHHEIDERARSPDMTYLRLVERLCRNLPQLNPILHHPRSKVVHVDVLDYKIGLSSAEVPMSLSIEETSPAGELERFRDWLSNGVPSNVATRFLVVRDLTQQMILLLGSVLGIGPECFAEHLQNSGYVDGEDKEPPPFTWNTFALPKEHMSIRWYRPVYHREASPPVRDRRKKILGKPGQISWSKSLSYPTRRQWRQSSINYTRKTTANISRSSWHMGTDPGEEDSETAPLALEERATIWAKEVGGCHIVVLLLDPLPEARDVAEGPMPAFDYLNGTPPYPQWQQRSRAPRTGQHTWETRALSSSTPRQGPYQTRTSQDSEIRGTEGEEVESRLDIQWRGRGFRGIRNLFGPLGTSIREAGSNAPFGTCFRRHSLYKEIIPRGPLFTVDHLSLPQARLSADYDTWLVMQPTDVSCRRWLREWEKQSQTTNGSLAPLWSLFRTIHHDTMSFLQRMDTSLSQIGQHTLDDVLLEDRLQHWRSVIRRFQTDVQHLEGSIDRLVRFISRYEEEAIHAQNYSRLSGEADRDWNSSLSDRFAVLGRQVSTINKSLIANLSIHESRRGIAEAESVTRLTELAFVFIPLTFSASIFSMQVNELRSGVSIGVFLSLAAGITLSLFALRLSIRSQFVSTLRSRCITSVRDEAGLRRGTRIPTHAYMRYFLGVLFRQASRWPKLFGFVLVAMISPPCLVLVWISQLSVASRFIISLIILLLATIFSIFAIKWVHGSDEDSSNE